MWRLVVIALLLWGCGRKRLVDNTDATVPPDSALSVPDWAVLPDRAVRVDLPPFGPDLTPIDAAPVKLADLTVTSFSSYVTPNTSYVYYYFTVCNLGQTYSSPTTVAIFINAVAPPAGPGDLSLSLIGLAPGDCISETTTTQLPKGTYSSWALVDPEGKETELDEGNNAMGPVKVVVAATSGVDLVVTSLALIPGPAGQSYEATVCNKGGAASSSAVVDLYIDSQGPPSSGSLSDVSKTTGPLAGGSCAPVAFAVGPLQPGSYQSWVWVDRKNTIAELDENNNLSGPFLLVVSP